MVEVGGHILRQSGLISDPLPLLQGIHYSYLDSYKLKLQNFHVLGERLLTAT